MTKSKGIGRGGARKGAGHKPIYCKFIPSPYTALFISRWEELGYESQDQLIDFCLAQVAAELS